MDFQIKEAVEVLKQGGIVIFPTDTAYGIGCRIDSPSSVERLFRIRKRPLSQPTPVLFNNTKLIKNYVSEIPKDVELKLMDKFWPGGLTIILPCKTDNVPELVRGNNNTLGVRIPDNNIILSIIENLNIGVLGPSANFHGGKTPYYFSDLDPKLVNLVDYVVEGECKLKQQSTVVDVTVQPWKILRQGAVKIDL
jgi:L-threonylcarbamoyladenylate synthase